MITLLQNRYVMRILHPENPHLLAADDEAYRSTSDPTGRFLECL